MEPALTTSVHCWPYCDVLGNLGNKKFDMFWRKKDQVSFWDYSCNLFFLEILGMPSKPQSLTTNGESHYRKWRCISTTMIEGREREGQTGECVKAIIKQWCDGSTFVSTCVIGQPWEVWMACSPSTPPLLCFWLNSFLRHRDRSVKCVFRGGGSKKIMVTITLQNSKLCNFFANKIRFSRYRGKIQYTYRGSKA
jgi:hypothetical protein